MIQTPIRTVAALIPAVAAVVALGAPAHAADLNLHRGSRGTQVLIAETRLNSLHFLSAPQVNQRYNRATVRAVKRFQRSQGLSVTGHIHQADWDALRQAVVCPPAIEPPVAVVD